MAVVCSENSRPGGVGSAPERTATAATPRRVVRAASTLEQHPEHPIGVPSQTSGTKSAFGNRLCPAPPHTNGGQTQSFLASEGGPAEPSATTSCSPVWHLVSSIRHSKSPLMDCAVSLQLGGELRCAMYTANAGNARTVLYRAGKVVRLTYKDRP
ncbi:hypothetical protein AURDEDRAFT_166713 [Auricularia subglabra TFB-10046 SS5]|nr:hypothetical protein AURDEDRAFT_166713 [Auricularia subglabra TFB-10046 SS5]